MKNDIKEVFVDGLFSNIYFVDSNPATIESVEIKKEGDKIVENTSIINLKLDSARFLKSDEKGAVDAAIRNFFISLRFNSDRSEMKYFKRSLRSIFYKKNPIMISKEILGYDWAIVSPQIAKELREHPGFLPIESPVSDITHIGDLLGTLIFESNESEALFLGMRNSIEPTFRLDFPEDPMDTKYSFLEYNFSFKGVVKKICLL
jgi:hypothetical protein